MRTPRKLSPGATYHVTSRINYPWMSALVPVVFKIMFLQVVEEAKKKFRFQLWNFTIQGTNFHFLIKPSKDTTLSEVMQWIKCNFTKRWNKAHCMTGHLWGERFKSWIVKSMQAFDRISKFIDEYAVAAHLVKKAKDWEFCALHQRRKKERWRWLVDKLRRGDLIFPPKGEAA
jgi:putative transposase